MTYAQPMGPGLTTDMGPAAVIAALNAWGATRDREALALRADLAPIQSIVATGHAQVLYLVHSSEHNR